MHSQALSPVPYPQIHRNFAFPTLNMVSTHIFPTDCSCYTFLFILKWNLVSHTQLWFWMPMQQIRTPSVSSHSVPGTMLSVLKGSYYLIPSNNSMIELWILLSFFRQKQTKNKNSTNTHIQTSFRDLEQIAQQVSDSAEFWIPKPMLLTTKSCPLR